MSAIPPTRRSPPSIPVHVQLLAADGVTILREQYAGATSAGVSGTFVLPANLLGGSPILKATELFTGTSSAQTISYTTIAQQTLPLQGASPPTLGTPVAATLQTNGNTADPTAPIAQNAFGPHIRDIAISSDGSQVLCTHHELGSQPVCRQPEHRRDQLAAARRHVLYLCPAGHQHRLCRAGL